MPCFAVVVTPPESGMIGIEVMLKDEISRELC